MKKTNKIKKTMKIFIGLIIGVTIGGGVYATTTGYLYDSDEVSYDNTTSELESSNLQGALDELLDICE